MGGGGGGGGYWGHVRHVLSLPLSVGAEALPQHISYSATTKYLLCGVKVLFFYVKVYNKCTVLDL